MAYQKDTGESSEDLNRKLRLAEELKPVLTELVKKAEAWLPEIKADALSRGNSPELPITRLPSINKKLWGIHKGKMTIIAGRTSQAKSVVAANLAWDLALQGKKVFFISLEMSVPQIIERMFCLEHKINNYDLLTGRFKYSKEMQTQWEKFERTVSKMPMIMSDMIGRNWQEVDDVIFALGNKPDVVFIDHLQEISSRGINKMDAIEEYLRRMRELAIRNKFALVLCSQINRMGQAEKDRRPQLHQLKGAGAIEEMADVVLLLHWQYHYDDKAEKNLLEINIAKNRCGLTGTVDVKFIPEYSRLEDYGTTNYKEPDIGTRIIGERCEEGSVDMPVIQRGNSEHPINPEEIEWEE